MPATIEAINAELQAVARAQQEQQRTLERLTADLTELLHQQEGIEAPLLRSSAVARALGITPQAVARWAMRHQIGDRRDGFQLVGRSQGEWVWRRDFAPGD